MRYIRGFLTGLFFAVMNIACSFADKFSKHTCIGSCKACGGNCLNTVLLIPLVGLISMVIGKVKGHLRIKKYD